MIIDPATWDAAIIAFYVFLGMSVISFILKKVFKKKD